MTYDVSECPSNVAAFGLSDLDELTDSRGNSQRLVDSYYLDDLVVCLRVPTTECPQSRENDVASYAAHPELLWNFSTAQSTVHRKIPAWAPQKGIKMKAI